MPEFVHLHLHTEYSLLDGACRIADIPRAVKKNKQFAAAITDHSNMYGAIEFYLACQKEGVKPIIGCEVIAGASENETGHLILLAENNAGYKNLMYLNSLNYIKGDYCAYIDLSELKEHSDGLIALSGCASGFVYKSLLNNNIESAAGYIVELAEIFGEANFFIEVQNYNMSEQSEKREVNLKLAELAKIYNIGLVATNDVHYINEEDVEVRAVLTCIKENRTLDESRRLREEIYLRNETETESASAELYLKTTEEMIDLFGEIEYSGAVENTVKIAERCNVNIELSKNYLPEYMPPDNLTPREYLRKLSYDGLEDYICRQTRNNIAIDVELYKKRLDFELDVIESMGYADYYLIVWDFINYAKTKNIPVGPGRGSGTGSLAAFCMGITAIDSIKYDLLFERFLNPERVSMPDFDIDLCQERRGEVIDYVINKYKGRAAHIITFGTMAARGVIRDVGRVMGINYGDVDYIARLIPQELGMTLDKALEVSADLKYQYENTDYVKNLIDISKKLEGIPRHASTHAAGIVITDKPIYEYAPIAVNADNSNIAVTQYALDVIAELGLLKIDFLGLRYLTIINNAVKEIEIAKKETHGTFDIESIELNDADVYKLYASGRTDGIFQFESPGMKNLLTSLKPESLEDIIAAIALFRPGPMDSIPTYIKNRHDKTGIVYKLPQLEPILEVTYGCIVYQEQVMQIFRTLAGYSYGQADIVRRAMSHKQTDVMEEERVHFIAGCIKNNIDEQIAVEIFDEMSDFAKYAFNKSHAAAYAIVSYRTAYLKRYYPKEFFAASLSSVININDANNTNKIEDYMRDCERMGIKIFPPDINHSGVKFTASGSDSAENGIRYGLVAVKNLGADFAKNIVSERESNGKYLSLSDFLNRLGRGGTSDYELNKRQTEALIRCGAFDNISGGEAGRAKLIEDYENIIDGINTRRRQNISGQVDLFADSENMPAASENPQNSKMHTEREKSEVEILYLKVQDVESKTYKKVLSLLEIFEGKTEVKIYEEKTKKIFARRNMGVELNAVFLTELKELLGEANVKVVNK